MKKQVQATIKTIAEQLAKGSNGQKTSDLKRKVGELYEQLAILEYLETQIEPKADTENEGGTDSKSYAEENWFTEPKPLPRPENKEELTEPLMEKIKDIVAQMPEESQHVDDLLEAIGSQKKYVKNDLEEFASRYQQTPVFERKEARPVSKPEAKSPLSESRIKSLNDSLNNGLNIGLNDRLAFIKHLFGGSAEDYARVLSQINTLKSFEEVELFIKGKVKPDYDYWLKKEEYAERFMSLIEKKFP